MLGTHLHTKNGCLPQDKFGYVKVESITRILVILEPRGPCQNIGKKALQSTLAGSFFKCNEMNFLRCFYRKSMRKKVQTIKK